MADYRRKKTQSLQAINRLGLSRTGHAGHDPEQQAFAFPSIFELFSDHLDLSFLEPSALGPLAIIAINFLLKSLAVN